jgi:hypothetical protein
MVAVTTVTTHATNECVKDFLMMYRILCLLLLLGFNLGCGDESEGSSMLVVVASCSDGSQNGDETGVDCGGECAACDAAPECAGDSDCADGVCTDGACVGGQLCSEAVDCDSAVCTDGSCAEPTCADEVQNGDEAGIDCGGACAECVIPPECTAGDDCESGVCTEGVCLDPVCDDGVKNGTETDLDCGGGCMPCADGLVCAEANDCLSESCDDGTCTSIDAASAYPDGPYGTAINDTIMDLTLGTADGDETTLGAMRADGGLLVIFSTAAWCGRCAGDMPELIQLYNQHHDAGLQMRVSLFESSDHGTPTPRDAEVYGRGNQLPFPVVIDTQGALHQFFPRISLPMVMAVDLGSMELLYADIGWDGSFFETFISNWIRDQ